jgi:hypothetical protein
MIFIVSSNVIVNGTIYHWNAVTFAITDEVKGLERRHAQCIAVGGSHFGAIASLPAGVRLHETPVDTSTVRYSHHLIAHHLHDDMMDFICLDIVIM